MKASIATLLMLGLGVCPLSLMAQQRPAPVPPPSAEVMRLCKSSESLIEDALKAIAFENVAGILDNSAPRETNRQLRVLAATGSIQIQQAHMQELRCAPIVLPISHLYYSSAALACALAKGDEAKCDRKAWVRAEPKSE